MEPARADAGPEPDPEPGPRHSAGPDEPGPGEADDQQGGSGLGDFSCEDPQPTAVHQVPRSWQESPVVGPTAALRGRAGGPGFVLPPGAVRGRYDPAHRSGWQLAHQVWQESGINWEPPAEPSPAQSPAAEPEPEPGWTEYPHSGFAGQSWPADGRSELASPQPAFAPLGAPTLVDTPPPTRPEASVRPGRARPGEARSYQAGEPGEPDELFRAWQGSVRQAAAGVRPRTTARRRKAWQLARVGVPAVVIVTVGAGAVMMLTGKTNEMLANRVDRGNPAPGTRGSAVAAGAPAALGSGMFPGYPGQRGTVTVSSLASAGGTRLAVGSADDRPAIWRRAADGSWTLVSASSPAVYKWPGAENLTSVAHGPAGWIAVGQVVSGAAAAQPVVVTSADGVTWQPLGSLTAFAGRDSIFTGVTATPNGYVVVGSRVNGSRMFAAMWWSADLRNWLSGSNGGLDGRLRPSTAYAVAATAAGFVAVGSNGTCHTVWTSRDGRHWSVYDARPPAGASTAKLSQVTVNGTTVVAAGYAITRAGDIPITLVSADEGWHWHQIVLPAPGGLGTVTALTAAGHGFVAAGQAGPAGGQRAVTWSSPDGRSWSAATPAGAGASQITALTVSGGTVSGTAQQGAGPRVVTVPAP